MTNISESPHKAFVRVAERRVNRMLKMFRLLGNLSNRTNYNYTEADVDKIFKRLHKELANTEALFKRPKRQEFKL